MRSIVGLPIIFATLLSGCNAILGITDHPVAGAGRSAQAGAPAQGAEVATSGTTGAPMDDVAAAGAHSDNSSSFAGNSNSAGATSASLAGSAGVGAATP